MPKPCEKVFIRGLIVPSEWNQDGQVVKVTVKTFDEDEYFINSKKESRKLLKFVRQEVELDAFVKKRGLKKFLTACELKPQAIGENR